MSESALAHYLQNTSVVPDAGFIAYLANLEQINKVSPEVVRAIIAEIKDQRSHLKMIASENYSSLAVQLAQANLFTDKYAEGYPEHRFYAGCENVDLIEGRAVDLAKNLFEAEHAYVQPHSGADANLVAFWAILATRIQNPYMENMDASTLSALSDEEWANLRKEFGNQRLLGMNYYSGGHLTHGYRENVSSRMFEAESYDVDPETNLVDYDKIHEHAKRFKPLILLAGYSAYPRKLNFKIFREIADDVGSVLMVDMAHFAGLVAGKVFTGEYNPVEHAHVVTTTTHKTLRGPRGGMVLCTEEFAEQVNKGCPLVLGGPLPHVMAAKAVAFEEDSKPEFQEYAAKIVENSSALAKNCLEEGLSVLTEGTDNHLLLIDVTSSEINGRQAESALREARITLNRNALPFDSNGPWYTSGLRIGTPALTTLGMGSTEMREIASIMKSVLANTKAAEIKSGRQAGNLSQARYLLDPNVVDDAQSRVDHLLTNHVLYEEIDLEYLQQAFL